MLNIDNDVNRTSINDSSLQHNSHKSKVNLQKRQIMQIYRRRLDLLNTWRDTTMVLECVWICRPLGVPRDLTKSCSCAICLFRLLMSCNTHTHTHRPKVGLIHFTDCLQRSGDVSSSAHLFNNIGQLFDLHSLVVK